MAVQQHRVSKSRKNQRRSHHALTAAATTVCKSCGKTIKMHRVCRHCGNYDDRKAINP